MKILKTKGMLWPLKTKSQGLKVLGGFIQFETNNLRMYLHFRISIGKLFDVPMSLVQFTSEEKSKDRIIKMRLKMQGTEKGNKVPDGYSRRLVDYLLLDDKIEVRVIPEEGTKDVLFILHIGDHRYCCKKINYSDNSNINGRPIYDLCYLTPDYDRLTDDLSPYWKTNLEKEAFPQQAEWERTPKPQKKRNQSTTKNKGSRKSYSANRSKKMSRNF